MLKRFRGCLLLLLTALIWGCAFTAQSEGMRHIGPFTFNAVRTLLGGAALLPVLLVRRMLRKAPAEKPSVRSVTAKAGICTGVLLCIASGFQQSGILYTTAGKAGFITSLYVVFVPLIGLLLHKRVPRGVWGCVLLAVAGFWLMSMNGRFSAGRGDLLVLVCAAFFALHILTVDHFCIRGADPLAMACIQFFTAGTLLGICMLLFETPELSGIRDAGIPLLYAGVMSCGVAYTLQILGQRETPPTLATLLMSLESVFAALSGMVILHESLSLREAAGCITVLTAVTAAQLLTASDRAEPERTA